MIICWFYRKVISLGLEGENHSSNRVRQHIASCASCRRFHEAETALARRLRQEAPAFRVPPSPFLAGKIVASARRAERECESHSHSRLLLWGGAAALAALGLLSGAVMWQRPVPMTPAPARTVRLTLPRLDFALPGGEPLLKLSEALDRPLDGEMQLVMSDARMAVHALAESFLPKGLE